MGWVLTSVALSGCESSTGVGWEEQRARLEDLEVRAGGVEVTRVPAGTPLEILVTSGGSSTCTRPGPVVPTANSSRLSLEVFDFVATDATACTDDLQLYQRTVLHTFFQSGDKTIRALGDGEDLVVTIEVTVSGPPAPVDVLPLRASVAPIVGTPRTVRRTFAAGIALRGR